MSALLFPVLRRLCVGLYLGSFATSVVGGSYLQDSRFSGFATFGLVSSNNPEIAFRRDVTQDQGSRDGSIDWRTDSLIGLQWYGSWCPKLDATVQVVARDRYDDSLENAFEWAFVRYRPTDTVDVRLGRLGTDIFLLSDYRQVGYAYPWVRPPQDFYGFLSLYHIDGVDINKQFPLGGGTVNLKAFYGVSDERWLGSSKDNGGVDLKIESAGFKIDHEVGNWHWRYTYVRLELQDNIAKPLTDLLNAASPLWPEAEAIARELDTQGKPLTYHALGAIYDNSQWWARAEGASLGSRSDFSKGTRYLYLGVGRRFGDFTVYGITGQAKAASEPATYAAPTGYPSPLAEQLAMLANAATRGALTGRQDQESFGLGLRWDFRTKMALKLQAERYDIGKDGAALWIREDSAPLIQDQDATVFSVSLDLLF